MNVAKQYLKHKSKDDIIWIFIDSIELFETIDDIRNNFIFEKSHPPITFPARTVETFILLKYVRK